MKNRKLISIILSMSVVFGIINFPTTALAVTGVDNAAKLINTASLSYDGEVKLSYRTDGSEAGYEIYQANKPVNSEYYGGFAFSQFELSDAQLSEEIASAEFSCYVTGTPGGKYKVGEDVFTSADSVLQYESSWLETFGFSGKGIVKTAETVTVDNIEYTRVTADFTADVKSMQSRGEKNVTMAITSSNTAEKMLSYGSIYQPALTLTFAADITPAPTEKPDAVYSVTSKATADETVIDTSKMTNSRNVTGYLVTVAHDKQIIKTDVIKRSDSVTITAAEGDDIEIVPIYEYPKTDTYGNGITLPDVFPDGRYNITVTNGATSHTDVYINGYMTANNIDQNGDGRSVSTGSTYTMSDVKIEGGSITIKTKDSPNNLSYVRVVKSPSIAEAKKKIFITGDSLVANYYGGNEDSYLGTTQTGWGQALKNFINTEKYEIVNLANSGYWASKLQTTAFPGIIYNASEGDIFLLESGVNDYWNPDTTEGSDANRAAMKTAVTAMVEGANKEELPIILVNPNAQPSRYDRTNCFSDVMLEVAEEQKIPAIDLAKESSIVLSELYGNSIDNIKANFGVKKDNTHSSYLGAMKYASIVATELYHMGYTDMFNTEYEYVKNDTLGQSIVCKIDTTKAPIIRPAPSPVPAEGKCVKITAEYDIDGSLKKVKIDEITVSDIEAVSNTDTIKTFYWDSFKNMKPLVSIPEATPITTDADYTFVFGTSSADNAIAVDTAQVYGEKENGMKYGFYGVEGAPDVSDGRTDGFKVGKFDPFTVLKSGEINGVSYITADYSQYDEDTLSKIAGGTMPVRFSVEAQQHSYYTITATIVNTSNTENAEVTLYSEKRHAILSGKTLAPGETVTKTFNVNLESVYYNDSGIKDDTQINISLTGKNAGLASLSVEKHNAMGKTIWLCTDSTGCDQPSDVPYFPLRNYSGTGSLLSKYINPEIAVSNQGEGGLTAGDSSHFNNAVAHMQSGDYLYVQYGLNDAADYEKFKANLEKYYTAAHEKGVRLIIVSPSERHSSAAWDDTNKKWKSSCSGFVTAGREFVEDKIADGADDIAFIDLNTAILEWMNDETQRIFTKRQEMGFADTAVSKRAIEYYYRAHRSDGIDSIHINDYGTDNAAYLVCDIAKNIIETASTDSEKVQAEVLRELVENMSTDTPSVVSDEMIKADWPINAFYPYPFGADITYEYPAMVKSVSVEGGTLKNMTVKVQGTMNDYAQGCADILDADGNVINTVYTVSTDVNDSIGHIDNTACEYGDIVVMNFDNVTIPTGGSYRVYLKGKANGAETVGDEYYSSIYNKPSEITDYLITSTDGESAEMFDYGDDVDIVGQGGSANGTNAWVFAGSSSTKIRQNAEKDGMTCAYLNQNGSGTYTLTKFFNDYKTVSNGKIKVHMQINPTYGNFIVKLNQTGKIASWMDGIEFIRIVDGEARIYDGQSKNGKVADDISVSGLKAGKWTDLDAVLDIDRGTVELSVAGGTPVKCDIPALQTSSWSDTEKLLPVKGITFMYMATGGMSASYAFDTYITDLLVTKVETDTPQINISAISENTEMGTVTGDGEYDINSDVTLTAQANDGYAFTGWYEGSELYSEESTLTVEKVRNNLSLTAKFAVQKSKEETASFDIIADKSAVRYNSTLQLTPVNARDVDGYNIGNLTASDIVWSTEEKGVIISDSGMVSFDDTFVINENATKTVTVTGTINTAVEEYKMTVYSHAYYEIINSAATNYDGEFLEIGGVESIIFPNANLSQVYALDETITLDKTTTITYNNAWTGPNGDGKSKTLSFCDSQGNTVFSVYYQWDGIYVGSEVIWKAVKKDTWQPITIVIVPETGTVSVTAVDKTLTTALNGSEIASIKFTSASGVSSDRELGISDIVITQ